MNRHAGFQLTRLCASRNCEFVWRRWAHSDSSESSFEKSRSLGVARYNQFAMLLYYITDRKQFEGNEKQQRTALWRRAGAAACAGVDFIQLREKDLPPRELELLARMVFTA